MEHSNLHVVLGPPGTGKTTKLLNLVENHLNDGVLPDHIGYLAFTKKAANEAVERACIKFDYTSQQLPYFRTIHSLCFQQLGLRRDDVMKRSHYKELGAMIGVDVTGSASISEGASFGMTIGDRLFFLENLSRIKRIPLRQVYDESNDEDINWFELERLQRALASYKKKRQVVDYTDMLMIKLSIDGPEPMLTSSLDLMEIMRYLKHHIESRARSGSLELNLVFASNIEDKKNSSRKKVRAQLAGTWTQKTSTFPKVNGTS